eukprot:Rmarinus@m.15434
MNWPMMFHRQATALLLRTLSPLQSCSFATSYDAAMQVAKASEGLKVPVWQMATRQAWLETSIKDTTPTDIIEIKSKVFGLNVRPDIIHEVVVWQNAKRRLGLKRTYHRSELPSSGRKVWRQKGTGRARHGDRTANVFKKTGVKQLGPRPYDYYYPLPRKVRALGVCHALSNRFLSGRLSIIPNMALPQCDPELVQRGMDLRGAKKMLFVGPDELDAALKYAVHDVSGTLYLAQEGLNVYDILDHDYVIIDLRVLRTLEHRLTREGKESDRIRRYNENYERRRKNWEMTSLFGLPRWAQLELESDPFEEWRNSKHSNKASRG